MHIEALGRDYPLAYTVEAQSKLAQKAGGRLEDIDRLFDKDDSAKIFENTVFILSALMEGYANRERVKCKALGKEYTGAYPPSYKDLCALLSPLEVGADAMAEISAAMKAGNKTTTETKPEKNVETTRSE